MGEKPDDIAKEIANLRRETAVIVDELRHRANLPYVARSAAERVTQRAETLAGDVSRRAELLAGEVTEAMPEPLRRNQPVFGGALLGLLAGLGIFTIANIREERQRTLPEILGERLRSSADTARSSTEHLGDSLRAAARQAQAARQARVEVVREDNMFKRLLWVGLVSVVGAFGAMLFQRLTGAFWRRTMHEEPPKR